LNFTQFRLRLRALLDLECCFCQIVLAHDIVTVEDRTCLVSRDCHCDPLRNPATNHVPDGRPSQIVEQYSGQSCRGAHCFPCVPNINDWLTIAREHTSFRPLSLNTSRQQYRHVLRHLHQPGFA